VIVTGGSRALAGEGAESREGWGFSRGANHQSSITSLTFSFPHSSPTLNSLLNALMMHGRNNGKKLMAVRIVKHTMDIIHLLSDQNPIQVIVDAIINSGPREDATRVGSAGVIRRQAVDMSPLRRVNQAIYLITTGAREAAFRNVKTIAECLADELINAAKGSSNSYAIKKKDELERVAKANR
jgi:small subunit ribosomal protein S5e